MALRWDWNNKCGELTFSQNYKGEEYREFTVNLYQGNAVLIMLYEYKDKETGEDLYSMWNFFVDTDHMKICLGLKKDSDGKKENLFNDDRCRFLKVRLNKAKNSYWKEIVTALATAFDDLTIELYSEKEENQ